MQYNIQSRTVVSHLLFQTFSHIRHTIVFKLQTSANHRTLFKPVMLVTESVATALLLPEPTATNACSLFGKHGNVHLCDSPEQWVCLLLLFVFVLFLLLLFLMCVF